jgi:sugar/nucleoside kinase (ribokinase family)
LDLVIIGHLAANEDRTAYGTKVSMGGSAYYCAVGASVVEPSIVGVVAPVGHDFDIDVLARLGVDCDGVRRYAGTTPRFVMTQAADGTRMFNATWGVAGQARLDAFPRHYADARHVHLATAPPEEQLAWILWLRRNVAGSTVSVDMFEAFASSQRAQSRQACLLADVVFLNDDEARLLAWARPEGNAQVTVLKHGRDGAEYIDLWRRSAIPTVPAPAIETTGAGDVLAGVFLALRSSGINPEVALRHAVAVATSSVQSFGVDAAPVAKAIREARLALGIADRLGRAS